MQAKQLGGSFLLLNLWPHSEVIVWQADLAFESVEAEVRTDCAGALDILKGFAARLPNGMWGWCLSSHLRSGSLRTGNRRSAQPVAKVSHGRRHAIGTDLRNLPMGLMACQQEAAHQQKAADFCSPCYRHHFLAILSVVETLDAALHS